VDLENRLPDETVNYTREHPLKEFAWLVVGITAAALAAVALLGYFAAEVAARLPFAVERDLIASHVEPAPRAKDPRMDAASQALRALGARVAQRMELPSDMDVDIRLVDSALVNAFATLGGQIRVHRGLVEKMADENALAFALAHEIAHVKLRHPVRSAGRGVAVGMLLVAVGIGAGGSASDLVTSTGTVTMLSFSRSHEEDADREALAAVNALYGHTGGSKDFFALLSTLSRGDGARIAILQTHPLSAARIADLDAHAAKQGWGADGARTPLPAELAALAKKR
jgi:predicted Zn-dependent protease